MTHILDTEEKLQEVLAAPVAIVHKWSPRCGVSSSTQRVVNTMEEEHPDIPLYRVDVISQRQLSARLAQLVGIKHESPQVLLLRNGQAVFSAAHWQINSGRMKEAVAESGG